MEPTVIHIACTLTTHSYTLIKEGGIQNLEAKRHRNARKKNLHITLV